MTVRRIWILAAFALVPVVCAKAQAPAPAIDPKVKAALDEIRKKQAGMKEFVIDEITTTYIKDGKPSGTVTKKRILKKAPNLYYTMLKHVSGPNTGAAVGKLFDGKTFWQINVASDEAVNRRMAYERSTIKTEKEIKQDIEFFRTTRSRADLAKIRKAGVYQQFLNSQLEFPNPIVMLSRPETKLVGETPAQWDFETVYQGDNGAKGTARVTFSKEHGLCTRSEISSEKKSGFIMTLDKIQVNPATPIPDDTFKYEPPPRSFVMDVTKEVIKMFKDEDE
ncbi:hypothetical protein LLG95_01435 [bacterium]|nr:hypothetical protein [bacterium]